MIGKKGTSSPVTINHITQCVCTSHGYTIIPCKEITFMLWKIHKLHKLGNVPFFNPVFRTFYFLVIDELIVSVLRPLRSPPVTLGIQHNIKMLLALLNIIYKTVTVTWQKDKKHILSLWIICKIQHFTFKHQKVP